MNQENEEHRTEEQPEQHDEGAATEPVPGKMVDGDEPEANASSESEEPVDSSPDPQAGVSEEDSGSPEENREPEPVEQPVSDSEDESGEGSPTEEPAQVPTEAEPTAPEEPGTREEDVEKKTPPPKTDKLSTLPDEDSSEIRWFVIHAHSGHENKVRQSLENRVRQEQMDDLVKQVLVPSEEVAEVKGGKKRVTSRKIFPGYVLVQMKLTHKTWFLVRTTPGVTGFIGSGKMPTPLEPEEIESIFEQMRGEQKKPKPKVEFEKDERVKIIEGPFSNFMGTVEEVNPERGKLKVMVEIFERLTPVELEFWQVEKT